MELAVSGDSDAATDLLGEVCLPPFISFAGSYLRCCTQVGHLLLGPETCNYSQCYHCYSNDNTILKLCYSGICVFPMVLAFSHMTMFRGCKSVGLVFLDPSIIACALSLPLEHLVLYFTTGPVNTILQMSWVMAGLAPSRWSVKHLGCLHLCFTAQPPVGLVLVCINYDRELSTMTSGVGQGMSSAE
jgi:hypothetical protein